MTSEPSALKACSKCGETKPLGDFHRQKSGQMGRHSWCRECFNTNARETRKRDYSADQKRRWLLSTRYGLTPQQVEAMMEAQGRVCAICRQPMARVCVDHSHTTGMVRGLLCHGCNIKLPAIEDEAFRESALAYLQRSPR